MSESEAKTNEGSESEELTKDKKEMGNVFLIAVVFIAIGIGCILGAGYGWLSIGLLLAIASVKYLKTGKGLFK
jgi:hypothetical protein